MLPVQSNQGNEPGGNAARIGDNILMDFKKIGCKVVD
jgi:hypothetical protein